MKNHTGGRRAGWLWAGATVLAGLWGAAAEETAGPDRTKEIRAWIPKLGDDRASVREEATRRLRELGRRFPAQVLTSLPSRPPDLEVQLRCQEIQKDVVDALTADVLAKEAAMEQIVRLLEDPDRQVRATAVDALGLLRDRASIQRIASLLEDPDVDIQVVAIRALGRMGAGILEPRLDGFLKGESLALKVEAIRALGRLGDKARLPRIVPFFKDEDRDLRFAALEAAALLDPRTYVPQLLPLLVDANAHIRREAAAVLASVGTQAEFAVPKVAERLEHPNPVIRRETVRLLVRLDPKGSGEAIARRLEDADPTVRCAATEALAAIPGEAFLARIAGRLEDGSPTVRQAAAEAVGRLSGRFWDSEEDSVDAALVWWRVQQEKRSVPERVPSKE